MWAFALVRCSLKKMCSALEADGRRRSDFRDWNTRSRIDRDENLTRIGWHRPVEGTGRRYAVIMSEEEMAIPSWLLQRSRMSVISSGFEGCDERDSVSWSDVFCGAVAQVFEVRP